jgi:hypothetical protein
MDGRQPVAKTVFVDPGDEVEGPCGQVIREGS